ncbi:unnamed protein product, partial [Timema podura]|nr:unnamed protein product [Timema podura]
MDGADVGGGRAVSGTPLATCRHGGSNSGPTIWPASVVESSNASRLPEDGDIMVRTRLGAMRVACPLFLHANINDLGHSDVERGSNLEGENHSETLPIAHTLCKTIAERGYYPLPHGLARRRRSFRHPRLHAPQKLPHDWFQIGVLLGGEENSTRRQMQEIINFETMLADITVPAENRRDEEKLYHLMSISQVQELAPFLYTQFLAYPV